MVLQRENVEKRPGRRKSPVRPPGPHIPVCKEIYGTLTAELLREKQRNQTFASNELRGVSGPGAWINVIVSEGKARGSGASERKAGRELFLC